MVRRRFPPQILSRAHDQNQSRKNQRSRRSQRKRPGPQIPAQRPMPRPRTKFRYSREPGRSVYPIRPGLVISLTATKNRRSPGPAGVKIEYRTFIWILSLHQVSEGTQPKKRFVSIASFQVPVAESLKKYYIKPRRSRIQFCYLTQLMKKGYAEIGTAKWNCKDENWRRFYKLVGYLQ